MTGRTLRFIERRSDIGTPGADMDIVVLDTWWTSGTADPPAVRPLRPVVEAVLAETDLVTTSLDRLDDWAAATHLADRFEVDGVSWWNKVRMVVRWDLHELMIWDRILADVAPAGRYDTIEVPWRRAALVEAARARSRAEQGAADGSAAPRVVARHGRREIRDRYQRLRRWAGQRWRIRQAIGAARDLDPRVRAWRAQLDTRLATLAADPPQVLAVAWAGAFHVVRGSDGDRRMDPHLTLVLDRLRADRSRVATVMEGLDHQRSADWPALEADQQVIPQSVVDERGWGASDTPAVPHRRQTGRDAAKTRLDIDGVDLGPAMGRVIDGYAGQWLEAQVRATRWAERFLGELRPEVLYLDREGTRTKWIVAARRRGIPVVAIQHGMIYPGNPEYCRPAQRGDTRPDVTCVFGQAERDLLIEQGGYQPGTVVVTGSPRADPVTIREPSTPDERAAVRHELAVRDCDRMLVVSVAHNAVMGDLYSATMVGRLLGGPLPDIHVVVKMHPQDRARADYPRLLAGLAASGGYAPPSVTMVRDMDIYRLLRSADAHLGQYSTVLTDAVVAGTPNMIAVADAYNDPLGHVEARVAVPVRSVDDVRRFMMDPRPATDADRDRFLRRHFEPGDATGRIAALLLAQRG